MFSCEFCDIFKGAFFKEHFRVIASINTAKYSKLRALRNFIGPLEIIRNTSEIPRDCRIFREAFEDTLYCCKDLQFRCLGGGGGLGCANVMRDFFSGL